MPKVLSGVAVGEKFMQREDDSPTLLPTADGQVASRNSFRSQEANSLPVELSIRLSLPAAVR